MAATTGPRIRASGPTVGLMLPAIANTDSNRLETDRLLTAASLAERSGFDGVYVGDHLLHPRPILESLVTLSVVAAQTKHVSIGTCVMLAALRSPLWLAKQLGTLAAFAPGRLRLGLGVGGEYPGEFEVAGVPLPERGRRLEEVIEEIRALFAGRIAGLGENELGLRLLPAPEEMPPLLLAGWKDVALKRAARVGDGWIGYLLSPESFSRRRDFLLDERRKHGAAPFITGMLLPVHPDRELEAGRARAAAAWERITSNAASFPERLFVAGPADAILEQLHRYWEEGCTEMVLSLVDQGGGYLEQLEFLAGEILPQLRTFAPVRAA